MLQTVLFVSLHDACRAPMAAACLNALAHPDKARATSAGTAPSETVNAEAVRVMGEVGIDISSGRPRLLTPLLEESSDLIIALGPTATERDPDGHRARETWILAPHSADSRDCVQAGSRRA